MVSAGSAPHARNIKKLRLDLAGQFERGPVMEVAMADDTRDIIRQLCTRVGCLMEDSSVIALMWSEDDELSPNERIGTLRRAVRDMVALLDAAEAITRGHGS
jgi:hypothetical protein